MFNLTQSVSEPTHNQGHLFDLMFSKQRMFLISTKLHHWLTSDHTAIMCKLDVTVPYKNKVSLTLSHKLVLLVTVITISALSLTSTPLSAVAQSIQGSQRPGSTGSQSSYVGWSGSVGRWTDDCSNLSSPSTNKSTTPLNRKKTTL